MSFYYNPLDSASKSIIGAIRKSEKLNIFVKTEIDGDCLLNLRSDDNAYAKSCPMQKVSGGFFVCLSGLECDLYWYSFTLNGEDYGKNENNLAVLGAKDFFQLTVYSDDYFTPEWIKGGIIYQIFPDRFNKSGYFSVEDGKVCQYDWNALPTYRNSDGQVLNNEFFGGSFNGIRQKLDYLAWLNVRAIYLNPINKAFSSHRYDTSDYLEIDKLLGTREELLQLIEEAKQKGISFIFDGVYNHTGADSVYFDRFSRYGNSGAYNNRNSEYFDWYSFSEYPNKYDCWWNFESLPSIKKHCISFQNFICDKVIKNNLQVGFSGIRLDVVDELEDGFVENIRKTAKAINSDSFIIGEVWEDATNKIAYGKRLRYFQGKQLDSVMNYPLRDAIISFILNKNENNLKNVCNSQINNFPPCALNCLMNVLSTHDSPRIITVFGRDEIVSDKDEMKFETLSENQYEKGKKLAKLAYALTFTLYGVPSIFYGDEVGLSGNLDPYNRKTFPWNNIDQDMLNFIKKLSDIRLNNRVFEKGDTNIIYAQNGVFVFERKDNNRQVIVAVSRRDCTVELSFSRSVVDILNDKKVGMIHSLKEDSVAIFESEI